MDSKGSADKLSPEALREAALRYLDRQDGSVEQVRRALLRRVQRYGDDTNQAGVREDIERVLQRLIEAHLLDDARFAVGFAAGQRRRGASTVLLRQKLLARGIAAEEIEAAIEAISSNEDTSEEASAEVYARKRRLLQRYDLNVPAERQKALAALARRGFSFDVAKKALGL